MEKLVKEKTELESEKFNVKDLKTQVNEILANSSLLINTDFFKHPKKAKIIETIQSPFCEWLVSSGLSKADSEAISQRLPTYFAEALHDEWISSRQDYAILKESLDTPFTQANEREQAWSRYSAWLQKQVEEPMFLEAFSLKQVFVPLRAYYKRKLETSKYEDLEETNLSGKIFKKIVIDLETELENWLEKADKNDAIRLISGGPGSGKSSLTKMFAAKLAEQGKIPILFIPLHHFEPSDDLIEAVGKFVNLDNFLPHNPLDSEYREERLLIIFDGLDELAMRGKIGEKAAQDFVREVHRKVERFNQLKISVQVLISGREVVVQANEIDFRKEGQILHVLPYFLSKDEHENYIDPQNLLEQDQRQLWWQFYGKASGMNYEGLPSELDQGNLTEITAQPLLNYLVALSVQRGQLKFTEETNLNAVYDDLLKAVYERGWEKYKHKAIQGIEEKDFVRILEEIALAAWHGKGRTTTVKEIENHCKNSGLKSILTRFQQGFEEDSKASVTRLLTAFYFRQSGNDNAGDRTFEFTHKSFGEYLIARRIVREVQLIHKKLEARKNDPDEGYDERQALERWVLLCGSTTMDQYVFDFIQDEVRLQDASNVGNWQQTFCELIGFMLRHGMPMECLKPRPDFQEENRQALNAEDSLLAVLGTFSHFTQKISKISFPSTDAFGALLARLRGQRTDPSNPMSFLSLNYLDLSKCTLLVRDFHGANFEGSNLKEGRLAYTNFIRAYLKKTNFEGANLERTYLERAYLVGANLKGANLYMANLYMANLKRTYLEGANLERTNSVGVNLVGANLEGANIERTNFYMANLEGANLKGANLKGVHLVKADLEGANLEGANLEGANLEGANLEGANLKNTILENRPIN
jgi:uncharacterized protein YjbI with pentapeptide repeats